MALSRLQRLAAGQLYDQIAQHPHLDHIEIDGQRVKDAAAARDLYLHSQDTNSRNPVVQRLDQIVERLGRPKVAVDPDIRHYQEQLRPHTRIIHRVTDFAGTLKDKFMGTKVGKGIQRYLDSDPERVRYTAHAEIVLKDGTRAAFPEQVEDVKASLAFKHLAMVPQAVAVVPMVPFVGQAVPGGFAALGLGAAAVVGSYAGVQAMFGKKHGAGPYAKALALSSVKQIIIGTSYLVPLVGGIFPYMSLAHDAKGIRDLTHREAARALPAP